MAGLLNIDFNDPQTMGLLTTGLALLGSRGRFGEALGQAGLQGMGAMQQAQQRGMQNKMQGYQLSALQRQEEEAKRQQAEREAMLRAAQSAQTPATPGYGGTADVNAALPPEMRIGALGAIPAKPGGFDQSAFLNQMMSINPLEAIKLRQSMAKDRPKYSQTPHFTPEGRAYVLGDDGSVQWLDGGVKPRDEIVSEDMGGKKAFRTKFSSELTGGVDKTPDPGAVLSSQTTMRGQNLTDARARERLALDSAGLVADMGGPSQIGMSKKFGKAPTGYRWKPDGQMERIPGGPADEKTGVEAEKRKARTSQAIDRADFVLGQLDDLNKRAGFMETGLTGATLGIIPGTDAYDTRRIADSIKANIGFGELQAMREASPTGGALGQVALQELNFLQSALGSLDVNQNQKTLKQSIDKIATHYRNWQDAMRKSQGMTPSGGASGGWSASPAGAPSDGWSATPRR